MNASTTDPTRTGSAYPDVSGGTPPSGTGSGTGLPGSSAGAGSSGLAGGSPGLSGSGAGLSDSGLSGSAASAATGAVESSTLDRVVQGAHEALDRAAEHARPAVDKLRGTLGKGESLLGERAEEWKAMQEQYLGQFRGFVREHPVATVAGALVAGLLLSRLMDDR